MARPDDGLEAPTIREDVRIAELARRDSGGVPPGGGGSIPPKKRGNALYWYGGAVAAAIAAAVVLAVVLNRGDGDKAPAAAQPTAAQVATQPPAVATAGADDYRVVATEFQFSKTSLLAPPNTAVSFTLQNGGQARHSLQFLDKAGGKELAAGASGKITAGGGADVVTFTTPAVGAYYFECAVHPAAMNGRFEVKAGAPPPPAVAAPPATATIDVGASEFTFDKKELTVAAGSKLTVNLKNNGQARHSLQFLDKKGGKELAAGSTGKIITAGQTDTYNFTAPAAGSYYYECAVHPGQMNGTLTVTGAGAPSPPPAVQTAFDVGATEFAFDKKTIDAPAGQKLTVTLKHNGQARHSIQFLDAKGGKELAPGATGKIITAGQTDVVSFTPPAAGSFYFECAVHPGQMNGTLNVLATTFEVGATEFAFDKKEITTLATAKLTFTLKHNGQARHSLQFLDAKGGKELAPGSTGKIITAGQTDVLTFTVATAGSYYFECAVHPGQMNGALIVRGGAGGAAPPAPPPAVVTAPAAVSRLQSGAKVQVIVATNMTVDPSGGARVVQALKVGDRLTVVTGTPAASTVVTTEGLIFWRVVIDGTQTIGWVPEVASSGSPRFLDLVR